MIAGDKIDHVVVRISDNTSYIQKALIETFLEKNEENQYAIKNEITELFAEDKLGRQDLVTYLEQAVVYCNENFEALPGEIAGENQDAEIAKKVMNYLNPVIAFYQSWYVYGKQLFNSAAAFCGKNGVAYTKPELLELTRQALTDEKFSLQEVSNLMEVAGNDLRFKADVPECVQEMLKPVKIALQLELTAKAETAENSLENELTKLIEGKDKFYNEFLNKDFFEARPKLKAVCAQALEFILELTMIATSTLKDIANYAYYKADEIFTKTAVEKMSDLNSNRRNTPVEWGNLALTTRNPADEFEIMG